MSSFLTIVIPVFNDFESLQVLLERIEKIEDTKFNFLIVDNGSTDPNLIDRITEGGHNWSAVRTPQNLGFGGGILFGIHECKTPWVGWMPGNLKIDPSDLVNFLIKVSFQPNLFIKALRVGRKPSARLKSYVSGLVQSLLLREKMMDTGGTPTICEKRFVTALNNPPMDYVFESYVYFAAIRAELYIQRPKIHYGARLFGNSHWQNGLRAEVSLMRKIVSDARSWR